jgi:hypothetical protein
LRVNNRPEAINTLATIMQDQKAAPAARVAAANSLLDHPDLWLRR